MQRSEDKTTADRYRLLFRETEFEYGGFEGFAAALPKPRKHYEIFRRPRRGRARGQA